MSWFDYNNGLFEISDFENIEYGSHEDDVLVGVAINTCPGLCIAGSYTYRTDYLEGNQGDDILSGGGNDDLLVGVDPDQSGAGFGEFDRLSGGLGYDTFVLGDSIEPYYIDEGYAIIVDFDREYDMLAVHGDLSNYTASSSANIIGESTNDTTLRYNGDIIAVFEDTTITLYESDFYFI